MSVPQFPWRCLVSGPCERVSRVIVNDPLLTAVMSHVIVNGSRPVSKGVQTRGSDPSRRHRRSLLRPGRRPLQRLQNPRPPAASPMVDRGRHGIPAPNVEARLIPKPDPARGHRADHSAAERADLRRSGCGCRHDPRPPRPRRSRPVQGDDLADPEAGRRHHPATAETAPQLLHPVRSRPPEPDLAIRLHPLGTHFRKGHRDHRLARRPLPIPAAPQRARPCFRENSHRHLHGCRTRARVPRLNTD